MLGMLLQHSTFIQPMKIGCCSDAQDRLQHEVFTSSMSIIRLTSSDMS